MSSAYASTLTKWPNSLQPTPELAIPTIKSLMYLEKKYGDSTPPWRVPLLIKKPADKQFLNRAQ